MNIKEISVLNNVLIINVYKIVLNKNYLFFFNLLLVPDSYNICEYCHENCAIGKCTIGNNFSACT